ncbi:tetratricopeptide repeat protein [Dokdonella soli]|uniref:Sel1 repeat family protein n=1 Tax=Dokdonella soli TaxID=529810 RepID=A0ABN1ID18_9GAMM
MKIHSSPCAIGITSVMAALVGCSTATTRINEGLANFQAGDCKAAFDKWMPLALKGIAAAQNNMGYFFEKGCPSAGKPKNINVAFYWYELAAKSGNPTGMRNLGWYHQHGLGTPQNLKLAQYWYETAARWGNELARQNLRGLGMVAPPPDLYNQAVAEQQAKARHSAEIARDVTTAFLGAAIGYSASRNAPSSTANTYSGPVGGFSAPKATSPAPTGSSGAFTGVAPNQPVPTPNTTFRNVGNTTYGSRPDGTTWQQQRIGDTVSGWDSNGKTWTIQYVGDVGHGRNSDGREWTSTRIGNTTQINYSDGTTKTCEAVGNEVSCH